MGIFTNFSRLPRKFFKFSRNDIPTLSLRAKRSNPVQSRKKAFTLAEIMIVLTVIGILTAILLPVAHQITPDENVIKFKKAHNTLYTVIRELVTSDQYYLDGDLGIRANGVLIDGKHTGDKTYFCNSIADLLNTKSVNCSEANGNDYWTFYQITESMPLNYMDGICKDSATLIGEEIILSDAVVYYQTAPNTTFGMKWVDVNSDLKTKCQDPAFYNAFKPNCEETLMYSARNSAVVDSNGFGIIYKPFCIDVDGIGKGEDPFGYGIRADGKILNGARATEWLSKSIQGDD